MSKNNAPAACTCPACTDSTESDASAFVCAVREAASKARARAYFRRVRLQQQRAALVAARYHRAAAARSDVWDAATLAFHARAADAALAHARATRAQRLAA
jgi:hypothetical protein